MQSSELNEIHAKNPKPGDYWRERCSLYHVVLDVLPNGNIVIADRDAEQREYQDVALDRAREITLDTHNKLIKYEFIDGFAADVCTDTTWGNSKVSEWKTKHNKKYITIEESNMGTYVRTAEENVRTKFTLTFEADVRVRQKVKIIRPDVTPEDLIEGLNSGLYHTTISNEEARIVKVGKRQYITVIAVILSQEPDDAVNEYTNFAIKRYE